MATARATDAVSKARRKTLVCVTACQEHYARSLLTAQRATDTHAAFPRATLHPSGGIYSVRLQFPDQYPEKPPRVRFLTEMYHPSAFVLQLGSVLVVLPLKLALCPPADIFADGSLCLDIIQDKWRPTYTCVEREWVDACCVTERNRHALLPPSYTQCVVHLELRAVAAVRP